MVMFTCNACGQSIKKKDVDSHCNYKCRNCQSLSCMDCGKEFWGNDYAAHIKCLTEDEKYGGKNFQAKPSSNKGELKQEKWIMHLKSKMSSQTLSKPLAKLLQRMIEQPNIPRKKPKFENFLMNAFTRNQGLIDEAWDIFSQGISAISNNASQSNSTNNESTSQDANTSHQSGVVEKGQTPPTNSKKRPMENGNSSMNNSKRNCKENPNISQGKGQKVFQNTKFKWQKSIKHHLMNHPGNQMPLSKLRKKVFAEFIAFEGDSSGISKEEVKAKLKQLLQNERSYVLLKGN